MGKLYILFLFLMYLSIKSFKSRSLIKLILVKTSVNLSINGQTTLTETVSPTNATNKSVTWTSSDSRVATVSNGLVTAVGTGTATITVKTVDGNKQATCTINVSEIQKDRFVPFSSC